MGKKKYYIGFSRHSHFATMQIMEKKFESKANYEEFIASDSREEIEKIYNKLKEVIKEVYPKAKEWEFNKDGMSTSSKMTE